MYLVNNIDQIHHLMNEPKKLIFVYNSDRMKYISLTTKIQDINNLLYIVTKLKRYLELCKINS